jgi:hypothetical protein
VGGGLRPAARPGIDVSAAPPLPNGEDFPGPKADQHSFGGKVTLNYIYTYFTTGMTFGYFADAWSFSYTLGAIFWGA